MRRKPVRSTPGYHPAARRHRAARRVLASPRRFRFPRFAYLFAGGGLQSRAPTRLRRLSIPPNLEGGRPGLAPRRTIPPATFSFVIFPRETYGAKDRYKDIQLPQLRSFCVAAAEASFTAAARRLGLATPTVWQQVRALEQQLQTTLMRRHGRNVELTDEGKLLLEIVQPHVNGLDSLESLFAARQRDLPPELTAAATPYLASSHLLKPLRDYTSQHPAIRLKLRVFVWVKQVVQLVEQSQATWVSSFRTVGNRELADRIRVFARRAAFAHHAFESSPSPQAEHQPRRLGSISAHRRARWNLRAADAGTPAGPARFAGALRIVMETPLLDSIRQYVAAGMGIALVHIGQQKSADIRLHVRPLSDPEDSVCVTAITRRGAHLSPPVEEFRETLRRFLSGSARRRVSLPETVDSRFFHCGRVPF